MKTTSLQNKIDYSIALIRRAEKLALRYDADNGFFLAFSGGKDSQALYHIAQMAGVKFKAHFSPTSIDPPQVIRFIREQYPDVEFGKLHASIYQVAVKKQIFPTRLMRWCCQEFKEDDGGGTVKLIGIRNEESQQRSRRKEVEVSGHKFSGDMDGFGDWSAEQIAKKQHKNMNFDQFAPHNEQMVNCIGGKDSIIVSPIIHWTKKEVWEFLNDVVKVPHCELYDPPYSQERIGCICCPMASRKRKRAEIKQYPHVKEKWIQAVIQIRRNGGIRNVANIEPFCVSNDKERELAEWAFEWWISGENYATWFAKNFQQQRLFK